MHGELSSRSNLGIRYHNYPHCGVNFSHTGFVREEYAKAINSSRMLASCGGRYHLAMNKIFESMGCCTAYVGEKPYGEQEFHLKDGVNYIAVDSGNFIEKIQYNLGHEQELLSIVKNAKETFEQFHHLDARARDFVELLKTI